MLKKLGFKDLSEVEKAIEPYDDHQLSMLQAGTRLGQVSRFEIMLQAALGEQWAARHPWQGDYWKDKHRKQIDGLASAGINVGTYKLDSPDSPEVPPAAQ